MSSKLKPIYTIEVAIDEDKLIESSVLHELEPIEDHLQYVIEEALRQRTIYEKGAIEIMKVRCINHGSNSVGKIHIEEDSGMNWDDDDMPIGGSIVDEDM